MPEATPVLSSTSTFFAPRSARWNAMLAPITPAPMIMMSAVGFMYPFRVADSEFGLPTHHPDCILPAIEYRQSHGQSRWRGSPQKRQALATQLRPAHTYSA